MVRKGRLTHGATSCYQLCYFAARDVLKKDIRDVTGAKKAAQAAMAAYRGEFEMVPHVAETSAVLGFWHAEDDIKGRQRRWK